MATRGRDSVAPGEIVASDWGNAVWDQSVQCFDSAADRNAQFPAPQAGAVTYLADQAAHFAYVGGSWRRLPGFSSWAGGVTLTFTASATAAAVVTFPLNRFAAGPIVVATPVNTDYNVASSAGATATSATIAGRKIDGTAVTFTVTVRVIAMEAG